MDPLLSSSKQQAALISDAPWLELKGSAKCWCVWIAKRMGIYRLIKWDKPRKKMLARMCASRGEAVQIMFHILRFPLYSTWMPPPPTSATAVVWKLVLDKTVISMKWSLWFNLPQQRTAANMKHCIREYMGQEDTLTCWVYVYRHSPWVHRFFLPVVDVVMWKILMLISPNMQSSFPLSVSLKSSQFEKSCKLIKDVYATHMLHLRTQGGSWILEVTIALDKPHFNCAITIW